MPKIEAEAEAGRPQRWAGTPYHVSIATTSKLNVDVTKNAYSMHVSISNRQSLT